MTTGADDGYVDPELFGALRLTEDPVPTPQAVVEALEALDRKAAEMPGGVIFPEDETMSDEMVDRDPAYDGIFKELLGWFPEPQEYVENAAKAIARREGAWKMYLLLALFDTRDGSERAELVRSAREGYERAHPDMDEPGAWAEFDRLWARRERFFGASA